MNYFKMLAMSAKHQGGFAGLLEDSVFNDFRLDPADIKYTNDEIGKGTYGKVFKVEFRGSVVAAKEFHPNFTIKGSKEKAKASIKYFQRCAKLRHDNVVRLFGGYENKSVQPYTMVLVMEKMERSLTSLLECGSKMSNSTKLSILLDVASGLTYMHSQKPPVYHFSLSSSNVLLTAELKAKISDIGVANMVIYKGERKISPKARPFMAPELQKSTYGPTADVFSYGVVVIHTISQQQPSMPLAMQSQCEYSYKPQIDQIAAADPFFKDLMELVTSCLCHDPNTRPSIAHVSMMIKLMTKVPDITEIENVITSHGHSEVQQTLEQVQITSPSSDQRNMTIDLPVDKPVPTLPYSLKNCGPKVVGFQNLGNTCFFNSMLQCVHQTVDLHYAIAKGTRVYPIENSIEGLLPVEVKKPSHGLTATLQSFFSGVNQHHTTISPYNLLHAIGRNNYRFGRGTQEDSHEVLRCLLSGLREEQINCIKQGVYSHYKVSQNFLKDKNIDGETKLSIKEYLSKVSRGVCDIDCTIGVEIVTTTICHECKTPLQLKEFCLDLALPMPPKSHQASEGRFGTVVTSKQKFNQHLRKNGLYYQDPLHSANFKTALEDSLWAFTKLDVLDENNKFICHSCSNNQNFQITQCRVSKQILIHKLSPVLILQMKRFSITSHSVTKDNQHVSFPRVLNMAPYCTTECIEDYADSKGQILYGLYGVVVHGGSLHGGHYTACVRQRPLKKCLSGNFTISADQQTYDVKAAEEGQWYYTSDSHVSPTGYGQVESSQAYLLFYEMLPGNEWLREVKRNAKASKHSDQVTESSLHQNKSNEENELANEIKESVKEKIAELDQMKAKIEKDANSFEETVQGYVAVLDKCVQAVKSSHKKSSEENLQAIEGYRKSYEKVLQDVEHLQTKHQQNIKELEEDQKNQANKFATELKSRDDEVWEHKRLLMHNAAIHKTKVAAMEEQTKMLQGTIKDKSDKLDKSEESKEAIEKEYQQALKKLEENKTITAAMKDEMKKLQDVIKDKSDKLDKSEESKQTLEKEHLKELEQYKVIVKEMKEQIMKQSNTLVQQNNTLVQQNTEMIEKLKMAEQDNKHTNTGTKHQETLEKVPGEKKIPGSDMEYNITECDKESQISALPKGNDQQLLVSLDEQKALPGQGKEAVKTLHDDNQQHTTGVQATQPLTVQHNIQDGHSDHSSNLPISEVKHHEKDEIKQDGGKQEGETEEDNTKQEDEVKQDEEEEVKQDGIKQEGETDQKNRAKQEGEAEQEDEIAGQDDSEQQDSGEQQENGGQHQHDDEQHDDSEKKMQESTITIQQQKELDQIKEIGKQQEATSHDGSHQPSLGQQNSQKGQKAVSDNQPVSNVQEKNDEQQENDKEQTRDEQQEKNKKHSEWQDSDEQQQSDKPQKQEEDGKQSNEQQRNTEQQTSSSPQETNNLAKYNDTQEENQQRQNSDLPLQDSQSGKENQNMHVKHQYDDNSCTKIKAKSSVEQEAEVKQEGEAEQEDEIAGQDDGEKQDSVEQQENGGKHQHLDEQQRSHSNYYFNHLLDDSKKKTKESAITIPQQKKLDQIREVGKQQETTSHDGKHQQSLGQQNINYTSISEVKNQKDQKVVSDHQLVSEVQEKNDEQQGNDKEQTRDEQQGMNKKHSDSDEQQQNDKPQNLEKDGKQSSKQQRNTEQQASSSPQETLAKNNGKQEENQQRQYSDLPLQDSQSGKENQNMHVKHQYDDNSCTKIKAVKSSDNLHKEKSPTKED